MRGTCGADGCDNPLPLRPGQPGRPPLYCSPACRPTRVQPALHVEVVLNSHDRQTSGRNIVVRLRRGQRVVVVANGLGRFSATVLATELRDLLGATLEEVS